MIPNDSSRIALNTWSQRIVLAAILLTATYATSINVADPDLWGHVQYGQDVLADGKIHETTTYSFTAVGFRWINHENLAELSFATIVNWMGPVGLLVFKFLLSVLVFSLVLVHSTRQNKRQGVHLLVMTATLLIVANGISYFWSIRPQLFTFTFFAVLIYLLNYCFAGWSDHWHLHRCSPLELEESRKNNIPPIGYSSSRLNGLWLAPILFFFWANSHGGFVAGVAIYVAYLGLRSIEALLRLGSSGFGLVQRFVMMSALAILATLINPYGPGLHGWLLESLGQPRPEITEWTATDFFGENGWRFGLITLTALFSLLFSRKEKDFTQLALMALTFWQALEHHRHVPFFAIFFAYWIPVHLESALLRFKAISNPETDRQSGNIPVMTGGLVCIVLLCVTLFPRLTVIKVEKDRYPVSAFRFLANNNINGKMVVTYNWAQYAIAAFKQNPHVTGEGHISFDGRFRTCYPQQIVDMHFDFICGNGDSKKRSRGKNSPPYDGSRILKYKNPELVVISRRQKHSVHMMEKNSDQWSILYQDELVQVWGIRRIFNDLQNPRFIPGSRRQISDEPQTGFAAWPAFGTGTDGTPANAVGAVAQTRQLLKSTQ
ncbi:hypothetical protein OAF34_00730 [Pirellulaceae bacterium]|nr:hypothetical protein [Pirellulaceae bacterium]